MSPELKERIYRQVLHELTLGTKRDRIMRTLETNRLTGLEAEELYRRAHREKTAMVRRAGLLKMGLGLGLAVSAVCNFGFSPFDLGRSIGRGSVGAIICVVVGCWGLITGGLEAMLASKKSTAVEPEDVN